MKQVLILIAFLFWNNSFSQVFGNDIYDESNFSDWNTNIKDYQGTYAFGFSELESELKIIITDSLICVQLTKSKWRNNKVGFIQTYENFSNVRIEGNKFFSDETNGRFVKFRNDNGSSVGLIVDKPWSDWLESDKPEFGQRFPYKDLYISGKYPDCSQRILDVNLISNMNLSQLQIMRNEIFARYGYKFKESGKMHKYFKNQNWYMAIYDDVNSFLTEIELKNIEIIKKVEKKKKHI